MSNSDAELAKMIRGFRVSDLQSLLTYAGRNKNGKKQDLQNRAVDLIKLRSAAIDMKIRELHHNRYSQSRGHTELEMYPMPGMSDSIGTNYSSRSAHSGPAAGPGMPGYIPNISKHMLVPPPHLNIPQFPVNPDVRLKELPFYDVLAELISPTSLVTLPNDRFQERELVFYFSPQQVKEITTSLDVEVQLRLCFLDTTCEQEDEIPPSICLKVNHTVCVVPNPIPTNKPGAEPRRPKKPIDISSYVKRTVNEGNTVSISWASSSGKPYVLGVYLVRKQTSAVLIRRLKANGVRNPDHTTAMIKEKLSQDRDSEIATMSLKGSLLCPLGKIKMKLPCRALTCNHLQCFDATLYLQMNEKKPKWICAVCDKPAYFKNLAIDGLFLDIATKAPSECTEVQFHEDGSWTPVMPIKKLQEINDATLETLLEEVPEVKVSKPKDPIEIISLDSDDSDTEDAWSNPPKKKIYKPSSEMSPVLIESPEDTQHSEEATLKSFDPFAPSSSKSEPSCSKIFPVIPEKSTLAPLPISLDIDSSDVDCILGTSPFSNNRPGSSGYESVSPSKSPKAFGRPASTFPETMDALPNTQSSEKNFGGFDLFSLIDTSNQEESFNFPPEDEGGSPDVINID